VALYKLAWAGGQTWSRGHLNLRASSKGVVGGAPLRAETFWGSIAELLDGDKAPSRATVPHRRV
jgi:hypothetical protein